jgi:hypothetical protein
MTTRKLFVLLGGAAACGVVAIVVLARDGDAKPTAASEAPRVSARHQAAAQPAIPSPTAAAVPAPAVADVEEPLLHDDKEYPVDPTPATHEEPLTEEERDPRMKRSIEMLDQAVTRTEAKLAAAEAAGDKATANTARVRIKRLQEVRKQRVSELGATR